MENNKNLFKKLIRLPKEERYDSLLQLIKYFLLSTLIVVESLIIATTGPFWWVSLILCLLLTTCIIIPVFVQLSFKNRIPIYVFQTFFIVALTIVNGKYYSATLFNIVLAFFYIDNTFLNNVIMGLFNTFACLASLFASKYLTPYLKANVQPFSSNGQILANFFANDFIFFLLLFILINLIMEVLRKNKELNHAVKEIQARERKLRESYEQLHDVTILKERNRIAKQIHDTTGHSITTIIMQTEAAKMIIDKDPVDAKNKIISANLQAVTALEEMRRAVHYLGDTTPEFNLMSSLTATINETQEGTGIVVRSKIDEDIVLEHKKAFFLYTSLKEGFNNGIRHGKSTAFFFELKKVDGGVEFLLSDNGKGTDNISVSFGLKNMQEEAQSYGGSATFSSYPDEGFEIKIFLPV